MAKERKKPRYSAMQRLGFGMYAFGGGDPAGLMREMRQADEADWERQISEAAQSRAQEQFEFQKQRETMIPRRTVREFGFPKFLGGQGFLRSRQEYVNPQEQIHPLRAALLRAQTEQARQTAGRRSGRDGFDIAKFLFDRPATWRNIPMYDEEEKLIPGAFEKGQVFGQIPDDYLQPREAELERLQAEEQAILKRLPKRARTRADIEKIQPDLRRLGAVRERIRELQKEVEPYKIHKQQLKERIIKRGLGYGGPDNPQE